MRTPAQPRKAAPTIGTGRLIADRIDVYSIGVDERVTIRCTAGCRWQADGRTSQRLDLRCSTGWGRGRGAGGAPELRAVCIGEGRPSVPARFRSFAAGRQRSGSSPNARLGQTPTDHPWGPAGCMGWKAHHPRDRRLHGPVLGGAADRLAPNPHRHPEAAWRGQIHWGLVPDMTGPSPSTGSAGSTWPRSDLDRRSGMVLRRTAGLVTRPPRIPSGGAGPGEQIDAAIRRHPWINGVQRATMMMGRGKFAGAEETAG